MEVSFLTSVLPVIVSIVIGLGLQLGYHVTYVRLSNSKSVQDTLNHYGKRLGDLEETSLACNKVTLLEKSLNDLDESIKDLRREIEGNHYTDSFNNDVKAKLEQDEAKHKSVHSNLLSEKQKDRYMRIGLVAVMAIQLVLSICVIVTCVLLKQLRVTAAHQGVRTEQGDKRGVKRKDEGTEEGMAKKSGFLVGTVVTKDSGAGANNSALENGEAVG